MGNFELLEASDGISHWIFELGSKESKILIIASNEPFIPQKVHFLHPITPAMTHFQFILSSGQYIKKSLFEIDIFWKDLKMCPYKFSPRRSK